MAARKPKKEKITVPVTPREHIPIRGQGRPAVDAKQFRPEYCEGLIAHMRTGASFETFPAYIEKHYGSEYLVGRTQLYKWVAEHPTFADAKDIGDTLSQQMWEDMGKAGISGQLRRVKSETPVVINGAIVKDANGQIVYKREYEQASFAGAAWGIVMRSRHRYRDTKAVEMTGKDGGPIRAQATDVPIRERIQQIRDDMETINACMGDDDDEDAS